MIHFAVRNVTEALWRGVLEVQSAIKNNFLIGTVPRGQRRLEFPCPVATTYAHPRERVLFDPIRDANPFFHFMESLWILNGSNDVKWLAQWLPSIAQFSDDGISFHGAYGLRLYPQLPAAIERLRRDPMNTRTVLQIYDWRKDKDYTGLDMPCNCMIFLTVRDGSLQMTVCNRSNDMFLGAYGANAVQFSMLQEYLADKVGVQVGDYVQFSNNMHVYPDHPATQRLLEKEYQSTMIDFYDDVNVVDHDPDIPVRPYPLSAYTTKWDEDLDDFILSDQTGQASYRCTFFNKVAAPMAYAHKLYRNKEYTNAIDVAFTIAASDWRKACTEWLMRRANNANKEQA